MEVDEDDLMSEADMETLLDILQSTSGPSPTFQ